MMPNPTPLLLLTPALCAGAATAQTFPIVPLTQPVYPTTDPDFAPTWKKGFDTVSQGSLQRLGDLDNDGANDLLAIFDISQNIAEEHHFPVMFPMIPGQGFAQPIPIVLDAQLAPKTSLGAPADMIIQDHDRDGANDIILVDVNGDVLPFLRRGDSFVASQTLLPTHPLDLYAPRIQYHDLNADALPDIILFSAESLDVLILHASSAAPSGYDAPLLLDTSATPPAGDHNAQLRVSDADADGDADILLTNGETFYVCENQNNALLPATEISLDLTNLQTNNDIPTTLADVNADGLADLVVTGETDESQHALGFVLAPFTTNESRAVPLLPFPDLESQLAQEFLHPRPWAQTLTSPGDLDADGTEDLILKPYEHIHTAWRITDPLNHNGRLGVSADAHLHGDARFDSSDAPEPEPETNHPALYTDANADGALDQIFLIAARDHAPLHLDGENNDHNGLMLAAALGNPFMPRVILEEQEALYAPSRDHAHLTHADLNADGRPEILTTDSTIRLVRPNPDGLWSLEPRGSDTWLRGPNVGFRSMVTQLDNDERPEVVTLDVIQETEIPAIFLNLQIPDFAEDYRPPSLNTLTNFRDLLDKAKIGFRSNSSSFDIADVDLDGDNDILIRGQGSHAGEPFSEAVLVWLNDGDANFTPGPLSAIQRYHESPVHTIAATDADADGDPDLISIEGGDNDGSPSVGIYLNDGAGAFTISHQIPLREQLSGPQLFHYWIETCDADADGLQDVMILNKNRQANLSEIAIIYASPSGLSSTPVYLPGRGAAEVHCADLDGNGLPDIYTCSYESTTDLRNSLSIIFQTAPRQHLPAISIHDLDFASADALDMNNDGALDLVAGDTLQGVATGGYRQLRIFYSVPAPCPADLNLDGRLNFFDISLFLRLYSERRPITDLNRDGAFNFFDISALLDNLTAGCP